MLMFRNATEAADFIQQYGLNINDGYVLFILYYVLCKILSQSNSVQCYFGDAEFSKMNALFCLSFCPAW